MRRIAAMLALVAGIAAAAWTASFVFAQREATSAPRVWPMGLGSLADVPKRYPPRQASRDAERLTSLAARAGIDLTPPHDGRRPPLTDPRRAALWRYIGEELARPDDSVQRAPAAVAQSLAEADGAIAEIRACLLHNAVIVWPSDIEAPLEVPLPNVRGHMALTQLLVGHALEAIAAGNGAVADEDLRAAWKLQLAVWHRPEMLSRMVALSGTRLVNAAIRKLPQPPAWDDEMRRIDYRRLMLAAQQAQTWMAQEEIERAARESDAPPGSPWRIVDAIVAPYDLLCAGNLAAISRQAAEEIAASRDCSIDAPAMERRIRSLVPFWNRAARHALPSLGSVWQRVARFEADLELTARVGELKRRRLAANGVWPAAAKDLETSACSGASWVYSRAADGSAHLRFTRDMPAARPPQISIPLEFVGR